MRLNVLVLSSSRPSARFCSSSTQNSQLQDNLKHTFALLAFVLVCIGNGVVRGKRIKCAVFHTRTTCKYN